MFFPASIDSKQEITDPNGNKIINLPVSPFYKHKEISTYTMKKVPSHYKMRPDLVSLVELGSVERTEYIMMFNQIGNPFSINEDDVLLIPDGMEADAIMIPYDTQRARTEDVDSSIQDVLIKNYYKYSSNNNLVDMSSYDDFLNSYIPSGNVDDDGKNGSQKIPYLLNDDEESMIIKNGKIYFNNPNDSGLEDSEIDNIDSMDNLDICNILENVSTELSAVNCAYNGTSLSDFIKALNNANNEK